MRFGWSLKTHMWETCSNVTALFHVLAWHLGEGRRVGRARAGDRTPQLRCRAECGARIAKDR